MSHWRSEAKKFAPKLRVCYYHSIFAPFGELSFMWPGQCLTYLCLDDKADIIVIHFSSQEWQLAQSSVACDLQSTSQSASYCLKGSKPQGEDAALQQALLSRNCRYVMLTTWGSRFFEFTTADSWPRWGTFRSRSIHKVSGSPVRIAKRPRLMSYWYSSSGLPL